MKGNSEKIAIWLINQVSWAKVLLSQRSEGLLASDFCDGSFVRIGKAVTSRAENEMTEWRRLLPDTLGGGGTISPARVFRTGPEVGIVSGGRCIW